MFVSINWPDDLDLLTLKLVCESHQWWGTFILNLGHARPSGSRVIRYVREARTDGQTDGQKQRLLPTFLLPTFLWWHIQKYFSSLRYKK